MSTFIPGDRVEITLPLRGMTGRYANVTSVRDDGAVVVETEFGKVTYQPRDLRMVLAAQRPDPAGTLTPDELSAVEQAGDLWNRLCRIVGDGPSRAGDLEELASHVHAIQRAVMAQAAARAYPDRFRLLGSTVTQEDQ